MEGVIVIDGTMSGAWSLQGDTPVFPGQIAIDLSIMAQATIDDDLVAEESPGSDLFRSFADPRGFRVTCGDVLSLLPLWIETDDSMVLEPA